MEPLQRIKEAEQSGHNMIYLCDPANLPTMIHQIIVETIQFNSDKDGGDVYYHQTAKRWMIHNQGLMKLALAAAIEWDVRETKPHVVERDFVHYAAVGCIKKEFNKPVCFRGDYEFDLEAERENLAEEYKSKAKQFKKDQSWIDYCVDRDYRFKRKHKLKLAASGAKAIVVNKLLGLKSGYNKDEIQRPFTIVRCIVAPNFEDPEVRKQLAALTVQAVAGVYGPRPELPQPTVSTDTEIIDIPPPANGDSALPEQSQQVKPEASAPPPPSQPRQDSAPGAEFLPQSLADFKKLPDRVKVSTLEHLADTKGYVLSGLPVPIDKMDNRNKCRFFEHLMSLPDVEIPVEQHDDDDIPF